MFYVYTQYRYEGIERCWGFSSYEKARAKADEIVETEERGRDYNYVYLTANIDEGEEILNSRGDEELISVPYDDDNF